MTRTVTAIFDDLAPAARAVEDLVAAGFDRSQISLVMTDQTRARHFGEIDAERAGRPRQSSPVVTTAAGSAIGAIAGALTAIAALAVPGGIAVAGPILAILGGASVGAVGGGVVGALIGAGIPEKEARHYEHHLLHGGILVGVDVQSLERDAQAMRILQNAGAVEPRDAQFWLHELPAR